MTHCEATNCKSKARCKIMCNHTALLQVCAYHARYFAKELQIPFSPELENVWRNMGMGMH